MPVPAMPGAGVPAPAAAPAATSTAGPGRAGAAFGLAFAAGASPASRAADPVDTVSLSPAALVRQALDAPVLAMGRLDGLLQGFEQVAGLDRAVTPRALGVLAGDIGDAARDLGAGVQPLLDAAETPATPRPDAAAALRVLAALAAAIPDAHAPGTHPADPAFSPARPDPTPLAAARQAPPRADAARAEAARPDSLRSDSLRSDAVRSDAAHQAREAVAALLGQAAATLGRVRVRLHDAPAPRPDDAGRDEAWCEAQVAAALGSVAHAARSLGGARAAAPPGIAALFAARAGTPDGAGQAVRLRTGAALLCCLGGALWATQGLDLGVARALTAAALGAAALAWGWRRAGWRRVRVEMRR